MNSSQGEQTAASQGVLRSSGTIHVQLRTKLREQSEKVWLGKGTQLGQGS
jgi:hypothetical protein